MGSKGSPLGVTRGAASRSQIIGPQRQGTAGFAWQPRQLPANANWRQADCCQLKRRHRRKTGSQISSPAILTARQQLVGCAAKKGRRRTHIDSAPLLRCRLSPSPQRPLHPPCSQPSPSLRCPPSIQASKIRFKRGILGPKMSSGELQNVASDDDSELIDWKRVIPRLWPGLGPDGACAFLERRYLGLEEEEWVDMSFIRAAKLMRGQNQSAVLTGWREQITGACFRCLLPKGKH